MLVLLIFFAIILIITIILLRNQTDKNRVIIKKISEICLVTIIFIIALNFNFINTLEKNESTQFNIITINSIIAGFLFTSLSILLSVSDKLIIKRLYNINLVDDIILNLCFGIVSSLISIVLAICIIFINLYDFQKYFCYIEINMILISVLFFILSVFDILFILKAIKKQIKKEDEKKVANVKETLKKFR